MERQSTSVTFNSTVRSTETSSSNLLSATYDWIVVDQIEDPEITEKDFLDFLVVCVVVLNMSGDDPQCLALVRVGSLFYAIQHVIGYIVSL
jgi:hypothetical protein